jgi:hypothetical protein
MILKNPPFSAIRDHEVILFRQALTDQLSHLATDVREE